jgi:signal transduction histidine kinase/ActR/RegA family two-component response regulator
MNITSFVTNNPGADSGVLYCIVRERRLAFEGTWSMVVDPSSHCLFPIWLPVSFDYVVHVDGTNHLIYPDDLDSFRAMLEEVSGASLHLSVRLIAQEGQIKQLSGQGVFSTSEDPLKTTLSTREEALQEYKILMESVIQSDIVALSVLRPVYTAEGEVEDFEWVIANKLLQAIAQGKDVIGLRYTEVFPAAERGEGSLQLLQRVLATGERESNEVYYENHHVKGWLRQVYVRAQGYVIVSAEDITLDKKKQAQILHMNAQLAQRARKQYQDLFGSIDQGFALVQMLYDIEGNAVDFIYLQVNPAFEKVTGLTDVVGKTQMALVRAHPRAWVTAYQEVASRQTPVRLIMAGDELETKDYEVYAFPTGDRAACTVAVLLSDVTMRQATARQLQALNEQLQQMDRAKTRFFSNVSHEFRTPLTLIQAPLQDVLRADSGLAAGHRRALAMTERNVLRLQKLVNSLLDFSRVEAGRLDALFQPTRLVELTSEIVANFRPLLERAGLKLVVKSDKLVDPVYVNRDMWEKIILNLLSNAFKFTHQGKVTVTLRDKRFGVQLVVRDTGIGISRTELPRIFERFYRQENVKARTYEGSGIGLALVRELVELHGGTIKVKSEEGEGTTFTITMRKGKAHLPSRQIFETSSPLAESHSTAAFLQEATGWLPGTPANPTWDTKKDRPLIFVVEDNADMRTYLVDTLSPQYRVMSTQHGRSALDLMDQGILPSLIVSDVMMPELDGYGLVSALRNNATLAHIPVILLSAHAGEEAVIEGMHRGAIDYLEKPFSSRRLHAFVAARLRLLATHDRSPAYPD